MRGFWPVLGLMAACGSAPEPAPKQGGAPTVSSPVPVSAPATAAPSPKGGDGKIELASGDRLGVDITGDSVQITGSSPLLGQRDGDRKRKYLAGKAVAAEVRFYPDGGFKLRKPDGTGLWRVRRYDAEAGGARFKVKRVVGDQSEDHLEVQRLDDGWTVSIDAVEVGRVNRTAAGFEVATTEGTVVLSAGGTMATGGLGLWLAPELDEIHRRILLAELLAAGL